MDLWCVKMFSYDGPMIATAIDAWAWRLGLVLGVLLAWQI